MKKVTAIIIIAMLGVASMAYAQPGPMAGAGCDRGMGGPGQQWRGMGGGMHKGMPGLGRILAAGDEIGLTEEQRDKLEGMMVGFQTEAIDLKASVEKAEVKLRALFKDDNASERDVMAAIDEVSRLNADMKKMHDRHFQDAKKILTADQIKKLKDMPNGHDFDDEKPGCPKAQMKPGGCFGR